MADRRAAPVRKPGSKGDRTMEGGEERKNRRHRKTGMHDAAAERLPRAARIGSGCAGRPKRGTPVQKSPGPARCEPEADRRTQKSEDAGPQADGKRRAGAPGSEKSDGRSGMDADEHPPRGEQGTGHQLEAEKGGGTATGRPRRGDQNAGGSNQLQKARPAWPGRRSHGGRAVRPHRDGRRPDDGTDLDRPPKWDGSGRVPDNQRCPDTDSADRQPGMAGSGQRDQRVGTGRADAADTEGIRKCKRGEPGGGDNRGGSGGRVE